MSMTRNHLGPCTFLGPWALAIPTTFCHNHHNYRTVAVVAVHPAVLGFCVDDPGAPGSYTGPYMLGSESYHVRNKQKQTYSSSTEPKAATETREPFPAPTGYQLGLLCCVGRMPTCATKLLYCSAKVASCRHCTHPCASCGPFRQFYSGARSGPSGQAIADPGALETDQPCAQEGRWRTRW